MIDTAINYRCQKAERTMGSVLTTLCTQSHKDLKDEPYTIGRDEIFVTTKNGYVPEDSDNGIPSTVLIE